MQQKLFQRLTLGVKDLKRSREFYQAVIETLGHTIHSSDESGFCVDELLIKQSPKPSQGVNLAFTAENPCLVNLFHETALKLGGICRKPPIENKEEGFYEAVVMDPDGNRIQAMYRKFHSKV